MQVRLLTASLALVVGCRALGCKSAPKMAWWSSSKGDKVESTAIAHAAPQLPSEIAKQTEAINTANPVQISTAPAFAANTSTVNSNVTESAMASTPVGAYPSTGAQSYGQEPALLQRRPHRRTPCRIIRTQCPPPRSRRMPNPSQPTQH